MTRSPRRNHITPVLRELHWLRINDSIIFKILILTHKAFNGSAPEYLCELITKHNNVSVRTRRAEDCYLLNVPPISKFCANIFFECSFMYAAPTLWNNLSQDTRMLDFIQFKSRIKTELYLKVFWSLIRILVSIVLLLFCILSYCQCICDFLNVLCVMCYYVDFVLINTWILG